MARPKEDLEKITLRLHRGDTDILGQYYPTLGYNAAIRHLVRSHCRYLLERSSQTEAEAKVEAATDIDLNI